MDKTDNSHGYDSRAVANVFVEKSLSAELPRPYTLPSLMRHVYFAHGWTLAYTDSPLISHNVRCWITGPAINEVFHAFKSSFIIRKKAIDPDTNKPYAAEICERKLDFINQVFVEYSKLPQLEASGKASGHGTPFDSYRENRYSAIPNSAIKNYYNRAVLRVVPC